MLLRLSTLATGRTGIRPETAHAYVAAAQRERHAGRARVRFARVLRGPRAARALCAGADGGGAGARRRRRAARRASDVVEPITLHEKEGLALINGTDGMLGMLVLAIADLQNLLTTADITAAMSVEGLLGTDRVFAADLHELRPQHGQQLSASNIRAHPRRTARSSRATAAPRTRACRTRTACAARRRSPAPRGTRSQHADAGRRTRARVGDRQPRRSPTTGAWSPTATSTARPSATCSTSWRSPSRTSRAWPSDGRTGSSTRPAATGCRRSWPTIPASTPGYMIAQYTQAAIVSELKRLAVPASVDSIPSSAMQEDHVSHGLVRRPQAAQGDRRAHAGARDRAADRRARHPAARAAGARAGHRTP